MTEQELDLIQRIMEKRSEIWVYDEGMGWVVIAEKELSDWGESVGCYRVDSKHRFVMSFDDANDRVMQRSWRSLLQESDHTAFHQLWMEWRKSRRPNEEQQENELAEAETVLNAIYKRIPQFDVLSLHQLQVQIAGRRYLGVRPPEETEQHRPHRKSHCWNCRRGLDNYRDFECRSCNWILCRCGACNCGCNAKYQCPRCGSIFRMIDCRGSNPFCSPECRYSALHEYSEYLHSSEWKSRREVRLTLDNHKCQDCGNPASEVHHLTYERIGNEDLDDLISLCKHCHAIRHGEITFTKNPREFIRRLSGIKN